MKIRIFEIDLSDQAPAQQQALVCSLLGNTTHNAEPQALLTPAPQKEAVKAHEAQVKEPVFSQALGAQTAAPQKKAATQPDIVITRPTGTKRAAQSLHWDAQKKRYIPRNRLATLAAECRGRAVRAYRWGRPALDNPVNLFCLSASGVIIAAWVLVPLGLVDWGVSAWLWLDGQRPTHEFVESTTDLNTSVVDSIQSPPAAPVAPEGPPVSLPESEASDASDKAGIHGDRLPMSKGVLE